MKKTVKPLVVITFLCLFTSVQAQLKLPVLSATAQDVKKIIADYPNRFHNLMGEKITEHPQSTVYQCNLKINGAEESSITRYSARKNVCSWEALMLTTESFEEAKKKFRSLYNQLNNLSAEAGESHPVRFKGKYESPEEEKKFTSVLFEADPATETGKLLKMEITLQFQAPMEWKVKVLVYDRDREDKERGEVKEGGL